MKNSQNDTLKKMASDIVNDYDPAFVALVIVTAPIWVPLFAAEFAVAKCVEEAAKKYKHHKENHNHHRFHLFHHSKNKENYDAPPIEKCAAPAYQN